LCEMSLCCYVNKKNLARHLP